MGTKIIPREVGKIITHSQEIRELRESLKLSETQKYLVIGTMLGDGSLIPNAWGKNYRLQIEHGDKQKDYTFWKYEILKNFVLTRPKFVVQNQSWKFRTISHSTFTEITAKFYDKNRHKIISNDTLENLGNHLVLSVWYMDDGGLRMQNDKIYGAFLNTQSFTLKENKLLQEALRKYYAIETLISFNHKKPRLYIPKRSLKKLRTVISPWIHDSLRYKLP